MDSLAFHDFALCAYTVSQSGRQIELALELDTEGSGVLDSRIRFSDVACYRFHHTEGAIITDIDEVAVATVVDQEADFLRERAHRNGVRFWSGGLSEYKAALAEQGTRAWRIDSAIGFEGFVLAQAVSGTCVTRRESGS